MERDQICNFLKQLTSSEYWYREFNIPDVFASELYVKALDKSLGRSFLEVLKDAAYYLKGFVVFYFKKPSSGNYPNPQAIFVITERNQFDQVKLIYDMMSKQMPCLFVTNKLSLYSEVARITDIKNIVVINPFFKPARKILNSVREWTTGFFNDPTDGIEDKIKKYINRDIDSFKYKLDQYLLLIGSISKFNSVKAIVVGNDLSFDGRVFVSYFQKKNVLTFSIQHGNYSGSPLISFTKVDILFVFGKKVKDTLQHEYLSKTTQVIVSGAPYLEKMEIKQNAILQRYAPFILVAFSGPGNNTSFEHHMLMIDALRKWSFKTKSTIIIKLHPKDNLTYYSGFGSNTIIFNREKANAISTNIFDWIKYSKFVITGTSNVANESILMNVPVLTLDFKNEYHGFEFIQAGASIHVKNFADFFVSASRLDADPLSYPDTMANAKTYIESYYARVDSPSKFICNYISTLISSPSCVV